MKKDGINSNTIDEEIFAIVDKLLEYKCKSINSLNKFYWNVNFYTQKK